jgi:hypothetical protein
MHWCNVYEYLCTFLESSVTKGRFVIQQPKLEAFYGIFLAAATQASPLRVLHYLRRRCASTREHVPWRVRVWPDALMRVWPDALMRVWPDALMRVWPDARMCMM